jgi:hypothetical protein
MQGPDGITVDLLESLTGRRIRFALTLSRLRAAGSTRAAVRTARGAHLRP